jgi:plasmid replication initiation protein
MADATPEQCGQLRLAAASALLRLARRHDSRINAGTYCALALMVQDEVEAVRAACAAKVYRLMRYFMVRSGAGRP